MLPLLLIGLLTPISQANAQARGTQPYNGAFARNYPDAAARLNGIQAAQAAMLEQLVAGNRAIEQAGNRDYTALTRQVSEGVQRSGSMITAMPNFAAFSPRVAAMLDWGSVLRWDLYDIYADPGVSDKHMAAEQAVDRYLARTDAAMLAQPKSMMMGEEEAYSHMFRDMYSRTNGLRWASQWLQLAVLDPLMYYDTEAARKTGVTATLARFDEMVRDAPDGFPMEMPTPAAVTPELVRNHPRAGAILHNLYLMNDAVADVLAHSPADKSAAVNQVVQRYTNPNMMVLNNYDWLVMSLRHGIYYQGGPAIGRLERPERNRGHGDHEMAVMPGMPPGTVSGGGGGGGPPAPGGADDGGHAGH